MHSRNKKTIKGMKFVAVLSILSMTVFSYSYNIALANEVISQNSQNEYHSEYSSDSHENSDTSYNHENGDRDDSDSSHVSGDDSDHSSTSHDDKGHDSDKHDSDHKYENNKHDDKDHDKITICHATHSNSNPYVRITISVSGEDAHKHHQDKEDIIPAPQKGCPGEHDGDNNGDHSDHHEHGDDDDHNGCDGDNDADDINCYVNTAPVITLIGESTINIYIGNTYSDQGATANDKEDGDITSKIVKTGIVDTSIVGSYVIKYDVVDSNGLKAKTVTRTVNVLESDDNNGCDGDNDEDDVNCPVNTAPVITLVGLNPITVTQGDIYLDAGATANDNEDGNITSSIVKTGIVDTSIVGTYTITYNVKDSQGLAAHTVTRTVNVVPAQSSNKGKITFCLVLGDSQNAVATSSYGLPEGTFSMSLGTSTGFATSTLFTKTWNSSAFAPNQKTILGQNDSDCVTYDNLDYGTYNYSEMSVNGSNWNTPKYNDQSTQPVNNVFDFFAFNNGDGDANSDGILGIGSTRPERTVYVYNTYKAGPACELPEITNELNPSIKVNQNFTLSLNASSTSSVNWDLATTSLPVGLSFATSTNTISGIPTVVGTYSIALKAINTCGYSDKTLVITVTNDTNGGGGSPSANLSVVKIANRGAANTGDEVQYTISLENKGPDSATNVKVTDILPAQLDFVSASTSVGSYATSTGVWTIGTFANGATTSLVMIAKVKSGTEGQNIANTASATSDQSDSDTTNNTSTVNVSVINPNNGGGSGGSGGGSGSNGPIAGSYGGGSVLGTSTPSGISALPAVQGCNYLLDYLRRDFNNNPFEVTKLQLFLINLEGFTNLKVTGVYDQATIDAVNVFQTRYKGDVLTPWGHTAPTSYVYILTKKKVNEIYCKVAFPVTAAQQEEIDNYRNSHLQNTVPANTDSVNGSVGYTGNNSTNIVNSNVVANKPIVAVSTTSSSSVNGYKNGVSNVANVGLTTLAGFSSSTKGVASDFLANIISSGKKIGTLLGAIFTIPSKLSGKISQNSCQNNLGVFTGINMILVLLILLISYFWYREYKSNKKIEEINKEIDLQ